MIEDICAGECTFWKDMIWSSLSAAPLQLPRSFQNSQIHIACRRLWPGTKIHGSAIIKVYLYSDQSTWRHQQSIYILLCCFFLTKLITDFWRLFCLEGDVKLAIKSQKKMSLVQNYIPYYRLSPTTHHYFWDNMLFKLAKNTETMQLIPTEPFKCRDELWYSQDFRLLKSSGISLINCLKGKERI